MARLARVVIPGHPHHVTQRGNGGARTFFSDDDYALYRDLLAASCRAAEVEIWAWCLMPNQRASDPRAVRRGRVAPGAGAGAPPLRRRHSRAPQADRAFLAGPFRLRGDGRGAPRRRATLRVAQSRAGAPGRPRARAWRWSSVRAHLAGRDDGVTALAPVRERYPDFAHFLSEEADAGMIERLRRAESIGRPLGDRKFLDAAERKTRRMLRPAKRGPKPREEG